MNVIESTQNHLLDTKTVLLNQSGLRVRYAELGDPANPPLLLLHGVPENLQAWYAVAPLLAETYHVLALDWPGFGGSEPLASAKDYTSLRFAEVIIEFMDSLQLSQVIHGHGHCPPAGATCRSGAAEPRLQACGNGWYSVSAAALLLLGAQELCQKRLAAWQGYGALVSTRLSPNCLLQRILSRALPPV